VKGLIFRYPFAPDLYLLRYDALSYAWGSLKDQSSILVKNATIDEISDADQQCNAARNCFTHRRTHRLCSWSGSLRPGSEQPLRHSKYPSTPDFNQLNSTPDSMWNETLEDFTRLVIPASLAVALPYLRSLSHPIHLWIDSICVDQSDLNERSQQVGRMSDIYSKGTKTIAWLGPTNHDLACQKLWDLAVELDNENHRRLVQPALSPPPEKLYVSHAPCRSNQQ
jgi:hypothetical protein